MHSNRRNAGPVTDSPWKIPLLVLGSLIPCLHPLVYYCILHVYKGSGDRLHCMGGYEYNSPPVIQCIFIPSNPNTPLLLTVCSPRSIRDSIQSGIFHSQKGYCLITMIFMHLCNPIDTVSLWTRDSGTTKVCFVSYDVKCGFPGLLASAESRKCSLYRKISNVLFVTSSDVHFQSDSGLIHFTVHMY